MKPFDKEICVKREADGGQEYLVIIGKPSRLDELDADDGDQIAVYRLVEVRSLLLKKGHPKLHTNPQLKKLVRRP